jgi:hypothetical protein
MGFWDVIFGRRPRIEPLVSIPVDTQSSELQKKRAQQIQQIEDVSKRLDDAAAKLEQAHIGLRTVGEGLKNDF